MGMLPVEDALARLLADAAPLPAETVDLMVASGRILAALLKAKFTQPPFDASAMDGYAVHANDVAHLPAHLKIIGEAAAGRGFSGSLGRGEAVRIFTGAPVPASADTIVIQENCTREGNVVIVREGTPDGGNLRPRGGDFQAGADLLKPGIRLGARQITLAAAMGHDVLQVHRKPIVAILASGDELVLPGATPAADQIVCSNPYGVAAMVAAAGGEARFLGIAGDTRASLNAHIDMAAGCDLLITIGGASVGDHDLIGPVLEARGLKLDFWKIAMRPGKPMLYGRLGAMHVLGLPGNPVSSLICARVFMMPLIERLTGREASPTQFSSAVAAIDLEANGPRTHYMRATLERGADGRLAARPVRSQDSSLLSPLAAADCLLVRPVGAPAVTAGEPIAVLPLDF
ncbi:MAG: gephyrin-like molybdotransferase Glp [Hyphomicrobiaceae bacterium]